MNIRAYRSDDQNSIIDLWIECDLVRPWNNPIRDIERKMKVNPELFLVGELDGEIITTVMGGYDGHRGWIYYLAVGKKFRRSGFGRMIMAYMEKKLSSMGCPKINLQIRSANLDVIEFYTSIGYHDDQVIGLGKRLKEDAPYDKTDQ